MLICTVRQLKHSFYLKFVYFYLKLVYVTKGVEQDDRSSFVPDVVSPLSKVKLLDHNEC